ncbi:hypothetical protein [Amycolatopsis vancoresmycina]|uniref:Type VII secretion protein EccE n=1 Tax=Amycolatopsis vancoresmycina DSM 44592 TaxID=1292037 RepID=R1FYD2_9PSEU|nr:hypothetical protein [Amycolatopsis vancoresmycina]EOD64353.1 hypothetical protein H480_32258 [Amycolatopsis vancoresmycina DSM 44592]
MDVSSAVPEQLRPAVTTSSGTVRLVFVPRVTRLLTKTWAGSLAIPFAVAGPLLVAVVLPLVAVVFGWAAMGHTALVLGGVLAALGLVLSVVLPWSLRSDARWVELTPGPDPARVLVKRLSGATRTSDLRSIAVIDHVKLAEPAGVELELRTADGTVRGAERIDVDARALADWLGSLPGVQVEHRKVVDRVNPTRDRWWRSPQVAAVWNVPADAVPVIADELGVRCDTFVPRAAARNGNVRAIAVYDPDDVQEITGQLTAGTVAAFMLRRLTSFTLEARLPTGDDPLLHLVRDTELAERYRTALHHLRDPGPETHPAVTFAQYSLGQAVHGGPIPAAGPPRWTPPPDFEAVLATAMAGPFPRPTRYA